MANDVVGYTESSFDRIHRTTFGNQFNYGVVTLGFVVNLVRKLSSTPKINVSNGCNVFDARSQVFQGILNLCVIKVTIENDH